MIIKFLPLNPYLAGNNLNKTIMKIPIKKFILLLSLFILISNINCNITEKFDPCDSTTLRAGYQITSNIIVRAFLTQDDKPISFQQVMIEFHKIECGSEEYKKGGDIVFRGVTDSDGIFQNGSAVYNIRNSNDRIIVIVSIKKNSNWEQTEYHEYGSANLKNGDNFLSYTIYI